MSVIDEIAAERQRQIEVEGWTPEHDDNHDGGQLLHAAVAYALAAASDRSENRLAFLAHRWWPWSFSWWKPKNRRRDLIRAGALIVAEIERLDRLEQSK